MNLVAAVLLFFLLPLTSSVAAQQTKIAVGYSGISADQLVIWIARDAGIFAKNHLDVQAVYFSGGTISVTAMIAGDTPIIQASGPGIVSAGLAGAEPIYVVGGITTLDYWLMTQPEIKTAEQLKGGTVAVARFGGAADFVARYTLPRLGLIPGKDVTIVQTGSTPERLAALEARRVSASTLVPPAMFTAQKKAFICSPMSPRWGWPISIKAASRPKNFCASIRWSCVTLSSPTSRRCTGSRPTVH